MELRVNRHVLVVLAASLLLAAGCSSPTLQEACADYCATIEEAGCPDEPPCSDQCAQIEQQLEGKCVEETTDALDCAAGEDFECRDGRAVVTSQGCLDEALTVLECQGIGFDEE